jgi:DNA-binding transcriptional LysR family regulator
MQRERLPFDLWALEVFLTVCETKTMAQAAAVLGLTQPGVSQIIQDMERQLGVELFDRKIRPIALTPAGTVLRQSAGTLIADARKVLPRVQRCRRGYLPALRVGLIYSLQRLLSVPLVKSLSDAADEVIMLSGITSVHATALLTRQLDLCIGVDDLPMEAGLDRWPILTEPYVVIAPRNIAAQDDLAVLAASCPLIRYSSRSIDGVEIDRYLRRAGIHVPRGAEFDTPFGLTEMVSAGLGWAISTPLCLIEAGVPFDALSIRPLPHNDFTRTITLVCRHKELGQAPAKAVSVGIQVVRDRCTKAFSGPMSWIWQRVRLGSDAVSNVGKV